MKSKHISLCVDDSPESVSQFFGYEWFQNLEDKFLYDLYSYYDNGIIYKWFQTVMYNFNEKEWNFLAMLPFEECVNCVNFLPITSVTFINKSGKM